MKTEFEVLTSKEYNKWRNQLSKQADLPVGPVTYVGYLITKDMVNNLRKITSAKLELATLGKDDLVTQKKLQKKVTKATYSITCYRDDFTNQMFNDSPTVLMDHLGLKTYTQFTEFMTALK